MKKIIFISILLLFGSCLKDTYRIEKDSDFIITKIINAGVYNAEDRIYAHNKTRTIFIYSHKDNNFIIGDTIKLATKIQ